ncbi:restriction endonuclease subunit S [uncultured Sulfitobacter sp.]|uniref:restriction endonuclease subunit S n=1 Tax=uncultured Sulfitobacter sp. TaxID=191468 RepID=UPI0030D7AA94|tara:strand:- start:19047 stop:20291 length:1245 start_codon:yes stop_codon:yes gene_type:complete
MVPEGWKQSEVGDHVDLLSGFPFKSSDYSDDSDDIRLLRGDNIGQGQLRWRDAKRWDKDQYEQLAKYHLNLGDFVIAMDRTWVTGGLKVAEVKDHDLPSLLLQRVSRLRAHPTLDQRLLRFFINGYRFEQYVKSVQTETAVPHISAKQIKEFPIPIPPLPEQRKIADILSTWDAAIEKTEALLATAKAQKRALMQSLLTGKRRFPEFEGQPWKEVRLGDVGLVSSAGVDKKTEDNQPEVRLLNFLDVFRREFIFDAELNHVVTAPSAKLEQCNVKRGDVFFTPSSETRDEIAIPAVAAEDMEGVCYSYHVVRFRLSEPWDMNFRAYVFQTDDFRRQAYKLGDGSGQRYVISQGNFRNMTVRVPSIPEQAQIGAILKAASGEIGGFEKQLTKLRTEKKALMQQLLTGKRRVVVDA